MRLNGRTEVSKCLSSLLPESLKGMDWGGGGVSGLGMWRTEEGGREAGKGAPWVLLR